VNDPCGVRPRASEARLAIVERAASAAHEKSAECVASVAEEASVVSERVAASARNAE
jgi:hypothetical protein